MKFERLADANLVNKLYKPTRLQKELEYFMSLEEPIMYVTGHTGYSSFSSMRSSYMRAIGRLGMPIQLRNIGDRTYFIRTDLTSKLD